MGACLVAAASSFLTGESAAQAHAFGERYDLPVPLWLNLTAGGAVVALSFVLVAWFLRPTPEAARPARVNLLALAAPVGSAVCALTVFGVRLAAVLLFLLALLTGYFGEPDYARNAAPTILWVLGWVGCAFVSALVGNIWLLINPWLILYEWMDTLWRRMTGSRGLSLDLPYPERIGVLPGIILIVGFVWFMLASGQAGEPVVIARMLTLYSAITWTGMALFGPAVWIARGEAFTLIGAVLARFSPTELHVTDKDICARSGCPPDASGGCSDCVEAFYRAPRETREINLRPYGAGLIVSRPLPLSMTIVVLMVLALVGFEGFMDTSQWIDLMVSLGEMERADGIHAPLKITFLFVVVTALLFAIFYVTSALMRRLGCDHAAPRDARQWMTMEIMGLFVLSLVPISFAYHNAHYLYWFFTSLQFVLPAASDPFGWGWNLFGTRDYVPDRAGISLKVIWHTAIVAIVIGHIIAVYVSHRVALIVFGTRRAALWSQLPMLVLMVAYTISSLWMLAQPIMG